MGCRPDASTWDNDRHPAARYPRWVLYRLDESLKQDAFEGTTQAAARTRFHNASIGYYLDPAPGGRNPRKHHRQRQFVPSPLSDSNRRPLPYHGSALPAELRGRSAQRTAWLARGTRRLATPGATPVRRACRAGPPRRGDASNVRPPGARRRVARARDPRRPLPRPSRHRRLAPRC